MTFDYSTLKDIAESQINDKGKTVTHVSVTSGTFNPATGEITDRSQTSASVKAVVTDFRDFQIDGSIIQRGDKMLLVSVEPSLVDKYTIDAVDYQVVNVKSISPGDADIVYKVQVRR